MRGRTTVLGAEVQANAYYTRGITPPPLGYQRCHTKEKPQQPPARSSDLRAATASLTGVIPYPMSRALGVIVPGKNSPPEPILPAGQMNFTANPVNGFSPLRSTNRG